MLRATQDTELPRALPLSLRHPVHLPTHLAPRHTSTTSQLSNPRAEHYWANANGTVTWRIRGYGNVGVEPMRRELTECFSFDAMNSFVIGANLSPAILTAQYTIK